MNPEDYVAIVRYGAGKDAKDVEKLHADIFEAGYSNVMAPLIDYIVLLANGGKRQSGEEQTAGKPSA
jgi:hypothetical protein